MLPFKEHIKAELARNRVLDRITVFRRKHTQCNGYIKVVTDILSLTEKIERQDAIPWKAMNNGGIVYLDE